MAVTRAATKAVIKAGVREATREAVNAVRRVALKADLRGAIQAVITAATAGDKAQATAVTAIVPLEAWEGSRARDLQGLAIAVTRGVMREVVREVVLEVVLAVTLAATLAATPVVVPGVTLPMTPVATMRQGNQRPVRVRGRVVLLAVDWAGGTVAIVALGALHLSPDHNLAAVSAGVWVATSAVLANLLPMAVPVRQQDSVELVAHLLREWDSAHQSHPRQANHAPRQPRHPHSGQMGAFNDPIRPTPARLKKPAC